MIAGGRPSSIYALLICAALIVWVVKVESNKKLQRLPLIFALLFSICFVYAMNSKTFGQVVNKHISEIFYSVQYPERFFTIAGLLMVVLFGILVADISNSKLLNSTKCITVAKNWHFQLLA
jgi:multisubunit Na+/H+ antiporter MnhE subunit